MSYRRKYCGLTCRRLPFLMSVVALLLINTWLWCKVFSLNCMPTYSVFPTETPPSALSTVTSTHTVKKISEKPSDYDESVHQLLQVVVEKANTMFNSSIIPEIDLSRLDVPTFSPSEKEELKTAILKMSKLRKEYEVDEMMKHLDKNEHNLKRLNISISLSQENNPNFEKKAILCKKQLDELVEHISEMKYNDGKIILKLQKFLDDLNSIDDRMRKYKKLLDKQKGLIIRKMALTYNLTFFESVIHG